VTLIDWEKVVCPVCHEQRKNTPRNKIWSDAFLTDKKQGKMVFFCTNHEPNNIYFIIQVLTVNDQEFTVRQFVLDKRLPKNDT